jgi:hypothetical protein
VPAHRVTAAHLPDKLIALRTDDDGGVYAPARAVAARGIVVSPPVLCASPVPITEEQLLYDRNADELPKVFPKVSYEHRTRARIVSSAFMSAHRSTLSTVRAYAIVLLFVVVCIDARKRFFFFYFALS